MVQEILRTAKIFHILYIFDEELANKIKAEGYPFCGGILDWGNYQRTPRSELCEIEDEYLIRFSLCCRNKNCRHRTMPPSCRFLGRKVYWSCVILVVMALRQNRPHGKSIAKLQRMFRISHHTISHWIRYFKEKFPLTDQWKRLRGKIISTVKNSELPSNLLRYFMNYCQSEEKGMVRCLNFLASGHL